MPCSRLYFGAVDTFFRIEYLCFGDFPFVVKEEYSNATSQQEEYFIFFRVQMAVWVRLLMVSTIAPVSRVLSVLVLTLQKYSKECAWADSLVETG